MREIGDRQPTDSRSLQSDAARKAKAKAAAESILIASKNVRLDGLKLKDLVEQGRH
jgi:hypothetical protein